MSAINYLSVFFFGLQLRRERIADRMKALQELVPNANKVGLFVDDSF